MIERGLFASQWAAIGFDFETRRLAAVLL